MMKLDIRAVGLVLLLLLTAVRPPPCAMLNPAETKRQAGAGKDPVERAVRR